MYFLLNTERVLLEAMELARLRISNELSVPLDKVVVRLAIEDGKVVPSFDVDCDVPESEVQSAVKAALVLLKKEMSTRIEGLGDRRVTGN